jgi:hypothetical protein
MCEGSLTFREQILTELGLRPRLYSSEKAGGSNNVLVLNTEGVALVIYSTYRKVTDLPLIRRRSRKIEKARCLGARFVKALNSSSLLLFLNHVRDAIAAKNYGDIVLATRF